MITSLLEVDFVFVINGSIKVRKALALATVVVILL
jgi:hypothetical protein